MNSCEFSVGVGFRRAQLRFVYNILRGKDLETGEFSNERRETQFSILQAARKSSVGFTKLARVFEGAAAGRL